MKTKKIMSIVLAVGMMSQIAVTANASHKHSFVDDVENSDRYTNRYYCQCGATKEEKVADLRDWVISLDANGGIVDEKTIITRNDRIRKLPIPSRGSDYLWEGWFTEPTGGEKIDETHIYDGDMTIYAQWSVVSKYTLIFATDGGSHIKDVEGMYGETISLDNYIPTKQGYRFMGWYRDARTKMDRVTEHTFKENAVLYAKWQITPRFVEENRLLNTDTIYLTDEETKQRLNIIRQRLIENLKLWYEKYCK